MLQILKVFLLGKTKMAMWHNSPGKSKLKPNGFYCCIMGRVAYLIKLSVSSE